MLNDAPEAVRDPWTGKVWKPHNYEKSGFEGPITLRQALTKSKNTVSVRLIEAITPQVAIDFARRAGIRSELPDNLTLALGTGEVTELELANAYTTFDATGKYADPILLVRVTDVHGTVLEEHQAAPEETIPPAVAYLATSLMRSVVEEGTAAAVRELGRPAAGKTGTANEYRDAWFSGYTPDLVATAWVGFDDHASLGTGETGGKAALPIWLGFMRAALDGKPARDFEMPAGVQSVRVDPTHRPARRRARAGPHRDLPRGHRTHRRGAAPRGGQPGPLPDGGARPGSAVSPALALLGAALLAAASPPPPALEGLADQLRAQAAAASPEPPVAVAVQSSSPALAEALGALLAARLAESGLPALVLAPGDDAPARARAAGARSLLGVRVQLGEALTAAGELRSVWRNFWAGRTPLEAGPVRVLAASATRRTGRRSSSPRPAPAPRA